MGPVPSASSAPIEDSRTTWATPLSPTAPAIESASRRCSGSPAGRDGGQHDERSVAAPKRSASAARLLKSATAVSAPRCSQASHLARSRTTARTGTPRSSSSFAVTAPTWPVTPVMVYIGHPLPAHLVGWSISSEPADAELIHISSRDSMSARLLLGLWIPWLISWSGSARAAQRSARRSWTLLGRCASPTAPPWPWPRRCGDTPGSCRTMASRS